MDVVLGLLVQSVLSLYEALSAYQTALLGRTINHRLLKSNTVINEQTTLANLTEATFGGYAPIPVTAFEGPYIDATGQPYMATPVAAFGADGTTSPDNIYGAYLTASIAGTTATGTAGLTGGVITSTAITLGGTNYQAPPYITITDGTGHGAIIEATITGGVVTALTIVAGGSGYTAPTLAFDAPSELVGGFNISPARSMGLATDGLPVVQQIS